MAERKPGGLVPEERRARILDWLSRSRSVDAATLADTFHVGLTTIRRDLDALAAKGLLQRVHGGAFLSSPAPRVPYREARGSHADVKDALGAVAASLMPSSGCVYVGGGTTTLALARHIPRLPDLQITTNALDIAAMLAADERVSVDVLGGTVRPESLQTNCEEELASVSFEIAFLSPAAIDLERGITTDNRSTARQERLIRSRATRLILLCDSSKVGRYAYARSFGVDAIDTFITDTSTDEEFIDTLRQLGVEVLIVPVPHPTTAKEQTDETV